MEDNNNALQGNALPSSALPSNAVQGDTMQFLKPPRGFGKVWYILYPILIFFGLTFLVQIIAMIIMAVSFAAEMPMTGDIAQYSFDLGMKVGEAAAANIVLIQTISYFLLAGLFFLLFRRDIKKRGLTPDKPARNGALPFLWMALTVGGYSIFFVSLVNITKLYEIFPEMMSTDLAIAGQSPILVIILTTVITPFTEELFFRGLLFKRLRGMLSFIPSAIISSIIFGIAHGSVPQFFYTFLLSILFCYIYEKYGSLLITIYCHFVLNSVIMVVNYAF
ncbi:MAG: CPBP family intramembrane metalloprotease, partial [Ruminococcus sp.]|nr:CPBP family intramembrane metalloprotease [Ruminococcus sp.]